MDAVLANVLHRMPGQERRTNETSGETFCVECEPGTFSKKGRKCLLCSVCHQGQSEVRGCTRSGNRVCRCRAGTYLKGGAICKTCSTCAKGFVQTLDCDHDINRACRKCPTGWTTKNINARVCLKMEVKVKTSHVVVRHVVEWWVVLFVSASVVALGGCVALCYWRFRRKKRSTRSVRYPAVIRNTELQDLQPQLPAEQVQFIADPNEQPSPSPPSNFRMVRDLPADLYEELGFKLNCKHPRNWVYLAGKLGFSKEQIRYLELRPRESTQNLINDWSSKPHSTVYNLHVTLTSMNRPDAAEVIENYVYIGKTENEYE